MYFPIRPLGPCCEWLLLVRHPSPLDTFARPHMLNEALLICHLFGFLALRCSDSPFLLWGCQEMWQPVKTYTSTNPPSMSHQDLCAFGLKFIFLSITFWVPLIFWAFLADDRDSDLHYTLSQLVYTVAPIWVQTSLARARGIVEKPVTICLVLQKHPEGLGDRQDKERVSLSNKVLLSSLAANSGQTMSFFWRLELTQEWIKAKGAREAVSLHGMRQWLNVIVSWTSIKPDFVCRLR